MAAEVGSRTDTARAFMIAVGVSLTAVLCAAVATVAAQPADMVAVVFPHGGEDGVATVAAHGAVVDTAWHGALVIAVPDTADFAAAVAAAGALTLIPLPRGRGCLAPIRR
jgi:hypothetical protein